MDQALASHTCSATAVFNISELVHLIASFNTTAELSANRVIAFSVGRSDLVQLSQVCCRTFGIDLLAPEYMSFRYDDSTGKLKEAVLKNNWNSAVDKLFRRFDIDAPHVKSLNVYATHYASLEELWYFATMPQLKRLTAMIDLMSTYTLEDSTYVRLRFDFERSSHTMGTKYGNPPGSISTVPCTQGQRNVVVPFIFISPRLPKPAIDLPQHLAPMSSSSKVLGVPELVDFISGFSQPSDLARLSRVCRRTFQILVPMVWKQVTGAHHLLGLIKTASLRYDETGRALQEIVLGDHDDVVEVFRRFNFYAPYVESFTIYGEGRSAYRVSGWSLLTTRANHVPLLPRLSKLFVNITDQRACISENEELMWVSTFATHTTQVVSISPPRWRYSTLTTFSTASALLEHLVKHCPAIHTLSLHPRDRRRYLKTSDDDSTLDGALVSPTFWYEHLNGLQALRHLSISEGWLYPHCLLALSRLPYLESLQLFPGEFLDSDLDFSDNLTTSLLTTDAFPALRYVSLQDLDSFTMTDMLNIPEIFQHVTRLDMDFHLEHMDEGQARVMWLCYEFLPLLENVPRLEELRIWVQTLGAKYPIAEPDVMDIMRQLPLRTVHLEGLYIGSGSLGYHLDDVWSNVTEVVMPSQYASLKELSFLADMPKLRRLLVMLDLTTTITPGPHSFREPHPGPLRRLESSVGGKLAKDFGVMQLNARVLLSLWPDLQSIAWAGNRSLSWQDLAKLFNQLLLAQKALGGIQPKGALGCLTEQLFSEMKKTCEHISTSLVASDSDSDLDSDARMEDDLDDWEE